MKTMLRVGLFAILIGVLLVSCLGGAPAEGDSLLLDEPVAPAAAPLSTPTLDAAAKAPATEAVEPTAAAPLPTPTPTEFVMSSLPAHDGLVEVKTLPSDYEDQKAIKVAGDIRTTVIFFPAALTSVQFQRLVCDDNCNSVTIVYPDGTAKDLTNHFDWVNFPAGGTGDAAVDAVLVARGLNIVKGETLRQNKIAIWLGNVPAGTYIVVVSQDDPKLMINVGVAYTRFVTTSDTLTIDVTTIPAK